MESDPTQDMSSDKKAAEKALGNKARVRGVDNAADTAVNNYMLLCVFGYLLGGC